jgi:hypothetical protein
VNDYIDDESALVSLGQLKEHPEWIPVVEAWWRKFKVSTYIIMSQLCKF